MPPQPPPLSPVPARSRQLVNLGLVAAGLLLVALIAVAFWKFHTPARSSLGLNGYLYFTLYPKQTDAGKEIPTVSRLNLATGALQYADSPDVSVTPSVSPDGKSIAYSAIPLAENDSENLQIRISDINSDNEKTITNSGTLYKRTPRWSPDGSMIAFAAIATTSSDHFAPNSWRVYTTDLSGNERLIANGANPYFSPDGRSLLFLTDQGVVLYDLDENAASLEWPDEGSNATVRESFGLSRDKKLIAWPDIQNNEIDVDRITSWSPFTYERVETIPVVGFWPVFSPDDRYLAFQRVGTDPSLSDLDQSNTLVIHDLSTGSTTASLSLDGYYANKTFITEWTDATN